MQYSSFKQFYPFYLSQHKDVRCRRLHFLGTLFVLFFFLAFLLSFQLKYLVLMPIAGYGFAWIGHYFFEKNKPATFKFPLYSLMGDFVMFKDIISGKIPF